MTEDNFIVIKRKIYSAPSLHPSKTPQQTLPHWLLHPTGGFAQVTDTLTRHRIFGKVLAK